MAGIVNDFKKFLMQGNVVDLAVAVVIGGAFGKVVSSLVENIVMPLVSMVMPGGDWKNAGIVLGQVADPADPTKTIDNVWKFGAFFASILDFVIIALAIFLIVRLLENAKKRFSRQQAIAEAEGPSTEERLVDTLDRLNANLERR
ncbi:large conductance mechanosensitive channel protein MscL [filamentous cyanobacterium LEGE 11480]|uniref:Large-conductance mechanosensitive channel n=1 Tax=Romeriopsis navalis LEGE 11480 TaxID=2777977 RepID=A0A928VNE3_9CYAN|nr:large conductance mechanosensitive channel protein MscL [Romeriopsis navalis]MBE9030878.1 large conductance mechanosensitive channel protein MscL [Romeriopsis navalis LEGE 11480]